MSPENEKHEHEWWPDSYARDSLTGFLFVRYVCTTEVTDCDETKVAALNLSDIET